MRKAVFLFGAGAVLDWQAPTTEFLTDLVRKTGFKDSKGNRVTEHIFETLVKHSNKPEAVNFETIINYIEEMYSYYSARSKTFGNVGNFYSTCQLDSEIEALIQYERSEINPITKTYSLSIPGFELSTETGIPEDILPEEKYCLWLLRELIEGIVGHVSKYSYFTSGHNVIYQEDKESVNKVFCQWMQSFIDKNYVLRMYTLNYDRIFKILLRDKGIPVFEGFDLETSWIEYTSYIPPNLGRILKDSDCHAFYNLHGNANWHIETENKNQFPSYQYYLTAGPKLPHHSNVSLAEIGKGKRIILSNIITGYQKVERTSISPYRQLFSAFDKDCLEADLIFIIGYSYGDEHINDIIRNARKYNQNTQIFLINPQFDDLKFLIDFLLHWGKPKGMSYVDAANGDVISPDYNVHIIKKKFGDFLKSSNIFWEG